MDGLKFLTKAMQTVHHKSIQMFTIHTTFEVFSTDGDVVLKGLWEEPRHLSPPKTK